MPRYFRKLFRTNHKTAHVRLRASGVYEIRLQIDGVRISASSRFLDEAKIKFLQKLKLFDKGDLQARQHAEKKDVYKRQRVYRMRRTVRAFYLPRV